MKTARSLASNSTMPIKFTWKGTIEAANKGC